MSRSTHATTGYPSPPAWLMALLGLCLAAVVVSDMGHTHNLTLAAELTAAPQATVTPRPRHTHAPAATPEPTPPPDYTVPAPEGGPVDPDSWFADAVFIGDSRTDGFKLFSGVTKEATFLDYTGLSIFDVVDNKPVIRSGDKKISVLEALGQKSYGKVYVALGVNELGYWNPKKYAETYEAFIDAVRQSQPDATLYIQAIIPVNAALCKAHDQPYYVTNERITAFNAALAELTAQKEVYLLRVDEPFLNDSGETAAELSVDGVHFNRAGYKLWLDYLITHTGQ